MRDTTKQNSIKVVAQGILPLFYHKDTEVCVAVAQALYRAGIRTIEFTNRGEKAVENFKALVKSRNESMPDLILAIGTIKNIDEAQAFLEAGADVLISPVFDKEIADFAHANSILWIPGCMTVSEIHQAEKVGCKIIKLFPGNVLGAGFVEAIKPLFPYLLFVVTGGVDTSPENLHDWFKAGVMAVGMGSKLITKQILQEKNYDFLQQQTAEVLKTIKNLNY